MIELQVLPLGTFYHPVYGEVNVTKEMLEQMIENFNKQIPHYDIPVNIEHKDVLGAVGFVKELLLKDDGLYAKVELTKEGEELLERERFNYTSAEYVEAYIDKRTGENVGYALVGLALTNKPANPHVRKIKFKDLFKQFAKFFKDALKEGVQLIDDVNKNEEYEDFVLEPDKEWEWDWADDANKIIEEKGWEGLARVCLFVDKENYDVAEDGLPHTKDAYYFPIAKLEQDGRFHVYFKAVAAALAYLNGARGGVNLGKAEKKQIYKKIKKWYSIFGKEEVPELKLSEGSDSMQGAEELQKVVEQLNNENEILKQQLKVLTDKVAELTVKLLDAQKELKEKKLNEIKIRWKQKGLKENVIERGLKLLSEDLSNLNEIEDFLNTVAMPELFERKYNEQEVQDAKKHIVDEIKKFF